MHWSLRRGGYRDPRRSIRAGVGGSPAAGVAASAGADVGPFIGIAF